MKRILWLIAGLVSGVAVTLWWGGKRSKALTGRAGEVNDIEYHLTTGDVEVELFTNGLIELWQPNDLIILSATQLDDICRWWAELEQSKLDSLADTQPIRTSDD